jgi:hypothetical protein
MFYDGLTPIKIKESMITNFSKKPWKKINDDEIWMWKINMNIGTRNVRSVFRSGALKVLHSDLSKLDLL